MARLEDIIEALEFQGESMQAFYDRQTASVVVLPNEELAAAGMEYGKEDEDGDEGEGRLADAPDWEKKQIALAQAVSADESGRFVALPDQFEVDEWRAMERFSQEVEDRVVSDRLLNAIHGRGAFRYFKDTIHQLGLADKWYAFRDEHYRTVAKEWCEANGIELEAKDNADGES
jgi:hypothetical protein